MLDAGELHLPDPELKIPANRAYWFSLLYSKRWVLYAKRPFGGPQQVLSYLANYTHRVALSNRRIVAVDEKHQSVNFTYRDFRNGSKKELTLSVITTCAYKPHMAQVFARGSIFRENPETRLIRCLVRICFLRFRRRILFTSLRSILFWK